MSQEGCTRTILMFIIQHKHCHVPLNTGFSWSSGTPCIYFFVSPICSPHFKKESWKSWGEEGGRKAMAWWIIEPLWLEIMMEAHHDRQDKKSQSLGRWRRKHSSCSLDIPFELSYWSRVPSRLPGTQRGRRDHTNKVRLPRQHKETNTPFRSLSVRTYPTWSCLIRFADP